MFQFVTYKIIHKILKAKYTQKIKNKIKWTGLKCEKSPPALGLARTKRYTKAKISSTPDGFSENFNYLIFHYILSFAVIDSYLDVLKGDLNFLFVELGLGGAVNKIK